MKKMICAALALSSVAAFAVDQSVSGYTRKDGTYVAPHMQTAPDASRLNNYSTQGNVNPYTGQAGTVDPYRAPAPRVYQAAPAYKPYEPPKIEPYKAPKF